jgi:hypothetical protein
MDLSQIHVDGHCLQHMMNIMCQKMMKSCRCKEKNAHICENKTDIIKWGGFRFKN